MNWTEGSLARHSRGRQRNALIARQKQHFARARSGLLDKRLKRGPISISFLPPDLNQEIASNSLRRISETPSYNDLPSTPPLPPSIREARQEHPMHISSNRDEDITANFNRRKRLLEKSDWAGLKLQEPLDISFPGQIYATKRWAETIYVRDSPPNEVRKHVTAHKERHKHLKRPSTRIQIGSQEIQPSIETSPQASARRYPLEAKSSTHRSSSKSKAGRSMQSVERREYEYCDPSSFDSSRAILDYLGEGQRPVNVVYSSPALIEPTPLRHFYSQSLQWFSPSSEDGESMHVEIERPVQPVPLSQKSDNEKWKDWVTGEKTSDFLSDSVMTATAPSEIHTQDSESSIITLPSHFRPQLPTFHLSSEPDLACKHSTLDHSLGDPQEHTSIESVEESYNTWQVEEKHSLSLSITQSRTAMKKDSVNDLNDTWRRFAYGDDEDSEELLRDVFKEAAHQAAVELRPSETSDGADAYTETAATCGTDLSPSDHPRDYSHNSSESYLSIEMTTCSQTAPSAVATAGSSIRPPIAPAAFMLPKVFVGKYANSEQTPKVWSVNGDMPRDGENGRRKRRKKMATDGRTDIRSLPNFDGDPIEEIED